MSVVIEMHLQELASGMGPPPPAATKEPSSLPELDAPAALHALEQLGLGIPARVARCRLDKDVNLNAAASIHDSGVRGLGSRPPPVLIRQRPRWSLGATVCHCISMIQ